VRLYETGFLISPALSEEETQKTILQMADIVSKKNGKMIKQDVWGRKRLAYPIKKANEATYVFFHYEGGAEIPLELERIFKQMDVILRYITVKKDPREPVRKRKKSDWEGRGSGGAAPEEQPEERAPVNPTDEEKR
jgi:small subunit ribosomal protein S6